jgi:hypothetical protein
MVQVMTQLSTEARAAIANLLIEILEGKISQETRQAILNLGDPLNIPLPYGHLVGYTQGYMMDNVKLAKDLLDELRIICMELLEEQPET